MSVSPYQVMCNIIFAHLETSYDVIRSIPREVGLHDLEIPVTDVPPTRALDLGLLDLDLLEVTQGLEVLLHVGLGARVRPRVVVMPIPVDVVVAKVVVVRADRVSHRACVVADEEAVA